MAIDNSGENIIPLPKTRAWATRPMPPVTAMGNSEEFDPNSPLTLPPKATSLPDNTDIPKHYKVLCNFY